MTRLRLLMPALLAALCGCASVSNAPPPGAEAANVVARTMELGGRFVALVGPRRQHSEAFLGVPGTNFYALRSWVDTRNGETAHQLYVEDSYFGAERNFEAAHDAQGAKLKFIAISKNEIACENGCSYAEEFAAVLPEAVLRAKPQGLTVVFTSKLGLELTIALPGNLVVQQLAAIDAARASLPTAAAAPAHPASISPLITPAKAGTGEETTVR